MNLRDAKAGREYIVRGISTADEELNAFLFSLGCYGQGLVKVKHLDAVNAQDGDIGILRPCNKPEAFPIMADADIMPTFSAHQ